MPESWVHNSESRKLKIFRPTFVMNWRPFRYGVILFCFHWKNKHIEFGIRAKDGHTILIRLISCYGRPRLSALYRCVYLFPTAFYLHLFFNVWVNKDMLSYGQLYYRVAKELDVKYESINLNFFVTLFMILMILFI